MHHPMTKLKQPNRQTHEKARSPEERAGSNDNVEVCCRKTKAPMLMSQAMHKQNPTNAQVSKAHEVQQGQL